MSLPWKSLCQGVALIILLGILAVFIINFFIIAQTNASIYESLATIPNEQVALVLGASVTSAGVLSPIMKERADAAVRLYNAHKVLKILVSGDNATLSYDEAYPVGKYLVAAGIPQSDIFLDYAGFDTYSSVYRAQQVFKVSSMIIVSQRFHLPRALFIAQDLGIPAEGFDADAPNGHYFTNYVRELPASIKALFDLIVHRVPKYLGQPFPVTGASSATWLGSNEEMIYFQRG